jgi:phospholipid-transporting ATPase
MEIVGFFIALICNRALNLQNSYQRTYRPKDYHIVQEIQRYNIPDYRPRMEWFRKAVHKVRLIQRLKRNRGYAFSQNESGEANLIRQYDTTRSKPKGY